MKPPSRSLAAVLAALAAGGACSVYGPDDLPSGGSGRGSGGASANQGGSDASGGRSAGGATAGTSAGGTLSGGAGGDGGQGDFAGADPGGAGPGGAGPSGGTGGSVAGGSSSAGAPPSGGTAAGGTASGGTTSGGAPTVAPELIDDMEDTDGQLILQGGRNGYWYTSADSAGSTVDPAAMTGIAMVELPSGEPGAGGGSKHAFRFTGKGAASTSNAAWGALGGFDFVLVSSGKKQTYDARAYKGIRFWAKANPPITVRVRLPLRDTTADAAGSKCGSMCDDHYLHSQPMTATWTQYVYMWSDFKQLGWGMPVQFDPATLIGVQFVVGANLTSEIWVDDVSFVPAQ